jgi:hypothetical protein
MHEVTDGNSYKSAGPQTTSGDAADAIGSRNEEIKNLVDNPEAISVEPTPAPTPTPTPEPKENQ